MSKVITLSRNFMKTHPKAGEPTYFVEKVWKSLDIKLEGVEYDAAVRAGFETDGLFAPKHHTIRGGKRFKTGDKVSLRVWSDKPYRSPQITIAPDVELTVRDVEIDEMRTIWIDGVRLSVSCEVLALNDGLSQDDFVSWFSELPFSGQIYIWNNNNLPY